MSVNNPDIEFSPKPKYGIPMPLASNYRDMTLIAREHNSYQYYDTPDGEDILKKTWYLNKMAGMVTVPYAFAETYVSTILYDKKFRPLMAVPQSIGYYVIRFLSHAWPLHAAATTFAISTYAITKYRGVDTVGNYAIGGALAGASLAFINVKWWPSVLCFSFIAYIQKEFRGTNNPLIPLGWGINIREHQTAYGFRPIWFSMYPPVEKKWVENESEIKDLNLN